MRSPFRRHPRVPVPWPVPPPVIATGPVSMHLEQPPTPPRLRVHRISPGLWRWDLGHGLQQLSGLHPTHREALAVGLAAAESRTLLERINR